MDDYAPQRLAARNVLSRFDCADRKIRQRSRDYASAVASRAVFVEVEVQRFMPLSAKIRRQVVRRYGEGGQQKAPVGVRLRARLFDVDERLVVQVNVEARFGDGFGRHRGFMRLAVRRDTNRVDYDGDVP